jgi:hypothetical protein
MIDELVFFSMLPCGNKYDTWNTSGESYSGLHVLAE